MTDTKELFEKGRHCLANGDHAEAFRCFTEVLTAEPQNGDCLAEMGKVCRRMGDYGRAIEMFERLPRNEYQARGINAELGEAYAGAGRYREAKERFAEAVQHEPGNGRIHRALGEVCAAMGAYDDAAAAYEKAVDTGEKESCSELVELCLSRGEDARAAAAMKTALARYPDDGGMCSHFARLCGERGRYDLMAGAFETAAREAAVADGQEGTACRWNAFLNSGEMLAGKTVIESRPVKLSVSLTRACNLNCIMCPDERVPWEIPEHTVREIRELLPFAKSVQWQGGEVFLSKYFGELFDAAARCRGLRQNIVTNGLLLDEGWIRKMVKAQVILELSIDGVTKGTYEKIRRGACFESLIGRLELIRKIRDEHPECRGFLLKMHFVVMKSNVAEIEQIVDFAKMYGIDELLLDKVIDFHDDVRFPREDIDRYPEILARVTAMMPRLTAAAQAAGIRLYHYFPVENGAGAAPGEKEAPGNVPVYCGVPWRRLTISTGGQIKPGCACMVPIGNVATDTLAEAWNGARMQIYRHTMAGGGAKDFCSQLCLGDMADRENAWHL